MKTVFLGTSWESVEALRVLNNDPFFDVVAVITAPDKPVGRKQILTSSEVKIYAEENEIPVVHTEKSKEKYMEVLDMYEPDIVVCKAFGEIVPKEFLEYPKYGCINIHFSLLPKYRGAVPIQKAILDGAKKTGISIMLMSEGLDEGDVLEMFEEEILDDDTNITLRERLVRKSSEVLVPTLKKWVDGDIEAREQDHSKATYCWQKDISKENAKIDWVNMEPEYIERMVRALLPWPVAWTVIDGSRMKIFKCSIVDIKHKKVGMMFVEEGKLLVGTKDMDRCIEVEELQIEGRKKISSEEYVNSVHAQAHNKPNSV